MTETQHGTLDVVTAAVTNEGHGQTSSLDGDISSRSNEVRSSILGKIDAIAGMPLYFQSLTSAELTPEMVTEISKVFRFAFNNAFPEFMMCQECGMQKPATEIFGFQKDDYVPLEVMDSLKETPNCPCCQNPMELFHDPQKTRQKLADKFERDAYLSLIRDETDQSIKGFTFGYESTLPKIFENEWKYRYVYSASPRESTRRDYNKYLEAAQSTMSQALSGETGHPAEITEDSRVFCWNCALVSPDLQKTGVIAPLIQTFFQHLPPDKVQSMGVIGETLKNSKPDRLLRLLGFSAIEDVLGTDYVLLVSSIRKIVENLSMASKIFKKTAK
jgi:hypothetical protein